MRYLTLSKKRLAALCLVLLGCLVLILLAIRPGNTYKLPAPIKGQLSFSVLYPTQAIDGWMLKANSTTYSVQENHQDNTFSFILISANQMVTISEQAYPDALVYENLVNGIGPYDDIGTLYGKLTLARPKYLNGAQAVVLNYSGQTLIFGHPNHDLAKTQWQDIINNLAPVKG